MTKASAYLRAPDIAKRLGVSIRTVRRWLASGALPSVRIGGTRLVAEADLQRRLTPNGQEAPGLKDLEEMGEIGSIGKALSK